MNFHPQALERGWKGHKETWMDEDVFKAAQAIKVAYCAGAYKGNAHAALVDLIKKAHTAGKAGHGSATAGYPAGQGAENWAHWILGVCRDMEWYDPAALPADEQQRRRLTGGSIKTDGYAGKGPLESVAVGKTL